LPSELSPSSELALFSAPAEPDSDPESSPRIPLLKPCTAFIWTAVTSIFDLAFGFESVLTAAEPNPAALAVRAVLANLFINAAILRRQQV
jgi:hypothetical protein